MALADVLQILVVTLAFLGLLVSLYLHRRQTVMLRKQLKLQLFADYTKRYEALILAFPEKVHSDEGSLEQLPKEEYERILQVMRAYYNLVSEEYALFADGYVEPAFWERWRTGILKEVRKPLFTQAWLLIQKDTYYTHDFVTFIEG